MPKVTKDIKLIALEIPNVPDFKSWTPYSVLATNTEQYNIVHSENSYDDVYGFRRHGDDYLVAMGTYYAKSLGERFKITTDKGNVFTVKICDVKSDIHTDINNQYTLFNNCIIEFYVSDNIDANVQITGTASAIPELDGKIIKIEKIIEN